MRALFLVLVVSAAAACGGGGGQPDGGTDGGRPPCVENPTTHRELINACTTAQKIEKNPVLPLLQSDGGLPPLP